MYTKSGFRILPFTIVRTSGLAIEIFKISFSNAKYGVVKNKTFSVGNELQPNDQTA